LHRVLLVPHNVATESFKHLLEEAI